MSNKPYRAQGAAMAIEDAAVLGSLLSRLEHPAQLMTLLRAYEMLRHARTAETQASSRLNQHIFHLPDGPEQQERDLNMRAAMKFEKAKYAKERTGQQEDFRGEGNSNQWADERKNIEQFAYDADEEADRWWSEKGDELCKHKKSQVESKRDRAPLARL